ncbi:MAG: transmembrane sensor [Lentisphaeria bacterium]|jgi:transmembrane sensor
MVPSNNTIAAEARDWFMLFQSEHVSGNDRLKFDGWLDLSDKHIQAYIELEMLWEDLAELQYLPEGRALVAPANRSSFRSSILVWLDGLVDSLKPSRGANSVGIWGVASACTVLAVLMLTFALNPAKTEREYLTEKGETKEIQLEDGSTIVLGGSAEIIANFSEEYRTIQHLQGEAFFDVAKDTLRPFVVTSAMTEVRVTGTQFSVKRLAGSLRVGVLEGRVEVKSNANTGASRNNGVVLTHIKTVVLGAGEKVVSDNFGVLGEVGAVSSEELLGWQSGSLVYKNETLADVIQDINRYSDKLIYVGSPEIERLKVTMSFRLDDTESIPSLLQTILPLRYVEDRSGNIVLLSQR